MVEPYLRLLRRNNDYRAQVNARESLDDGWHWSPEHVLGIVPARYARAVLDAVPSLTVDPDSLAQLPEDDGLRDEGIDWSAYALSNAVRNVIQATGKACVGAVPESVARARLEQCELAERHSLTSDPWEWRDRIMPEGLCRQAHDALEVMTEALVRDGYSMTHRNPEADLRVLIDLMEVVSRHARPRGVERRHAEARPHMMSR